MGSMRNSTKTHMQKNFDLSKSVGGAKLYKLYKHKLRDKVVLLTLFQ